MSKKQNITACGQPPSHWYDSPWVNILGNGVTVKDLRVTRSEKSERKVNLGADLVFDFDEGIEWMIVVAGLDAVNSMLHMESQTSTVNAAVRTAPGEVVEMHFQFHDRSRSKRPFIEPEARVLAALVPEWAAKQCGLL